MREDASLNTPMLTKTAYFMADLRKKVKSVYTVAKPSVSPRPSSEEVVKRVVTPRQNSVEARERFLQDLCTGDMPGLLEARRPRDVTPSDDGLKKKPPRKPSFKTRRVEALASKYNLLDAGSSPRVVVSRVNSSRGAGVRPGVRARVSQVMAVVERFEGEKVKPRGDLNMRSSLGVNPVATKFEVKDLKEMPKLGLKSEVDEVKRVDSKSGLKLVSKYETNGTKEVAKVGVKNAVNQMKTVEPKSEMILNKPKPLKTFHKGVEWNLKLKAINESQDVTCVKRPVTQTQDTNTEDKPSGKIVPQKLQANSIASKPDGKVCTNLTASSSTLPSHNTNPSVVTANRSALYSKQLLPAAQHVEEDSEYEIIEAGQQMQHKANTSFLWGLVQSGVTSGKMLLESRKVEEEVDIELTSDQEDEIYDDVHPPSTQHYSSLENIYDDVGNLQVERQSEEERCENASLRDYEYVQGCNIYASLSQVTAETVSNCYETISLYASDAVSRNNSLYGGLHPTVLLDDGQQYAINSYQLTSLGQPRSDTSDEWIDVELSDTEIIKPAPVLQERSRAHVGRSPSWSQRVRRQWSSRSPRKPRRESSGSDSDSHHYEVLYEQNELRSSEVPFDDFDSGNSEEEVELRQPYNGRLPEPPPPPQNIYAISKMAEAAGNKLLQLRKSLSRMRVKRHTTEIRLQDAPLSLPPPPPPPAPDSNGRMENNARKYWSLRKFKRSRSVQSSTFYLTEAVDVDAKSSNDSVSDKVLDSTTSTQRRTTRPSSPPPLPPDVPKRPLRRDKQRHSTASSWYAECGLFEVKRQADRPLESSWYADVGLWEADKSDTIVPSPPDSSISDSEQRFIDEPLYQFYNASVVELAQRDLSETSDSGSDSVEAPECNVRPTAMQLVPGHGQHRTLWCEIPEVVNSCVLDTLTARQKKLQEARFEILASQASYVKSLGVLVEHFVESPLLADTAVVCKSDARILFGNVNAVRVCARRLLSRLEQCWQRSFMLYDICDVIYEHANKHFSVYVKYCSNQIYLDRTLRRLKQEQGKFLEALTALESHPACESLSLHSFLMLPMQRITRLPLLLDAVLSRLQTEDSDDYHSCARALHSLSQVVKQCNEGARCMERMEEMLILSRRLQFARNIKPVSVISSSRWLVRSGEMSQLTWRGEDKMTFGRRLAKSSVYVFLFTDLLLVAKKKSDEMYLVTDYCARNLVQLTSVDSSTGLPVKMLTEAGKNPMLLTLLSNHDKKTIEMVMSCSLESDRQRWLSAIQQPTSDNPDESIYEHWDCPQVSAIHNFLASQPDELALDVADVVNVLRKLADGWYYGERIRDGETGWFPANHTAEIASAHVRARNLKQRYRLLALSGNFLDAQRKTK